MIFDWRTLVAARMRRARARQTADLPPLTREIQALEPRQLLTSLLEGAPGVVLDEYGNETWAEGDLPPETSVESGLDDGTVALVNLPEGIISGSDDISDVNDGTYNLANTFNLHSNAGSNFTIYLDFNGHTTTGTYWNTYYNSSNDIVTQAWSQDGDRSSFSTSEQQMIQRIWASVAEDFAPFDVNVTTVDPGAAALTRGGITDSQWGVRVVIGPNSFFSPSGGVAYIGSFTWSTDTPAFVFNSSEVGVREAVSHEVGHALRLYHDGTSATSYYTGHGSGATSWSPIMGVGYYTSVSQWSRGEYSDANNSEDDLQIITSGNGFGYRADDAGNTFGTASALSVNGTSLTGQGIIEQNTDIDVYSFTTSSGNITLNIDAALYSANLDVFAAVYDSAGNLIAVSNPTGSLSASFNLILAAGTYYVTIDGTGTGDPSTGYSDYGSLGNYWISGTIAPNQEPVANDDAAATNEDTAVMINVVANDTDPEGQPLTIIGLTNGSNGTVAYSNGQVVYTPNANFFGSDTFTYTISDGNGGMDTATVTVTVVSAPETANVTGPSGSTADNTPTMTWDALGDASRYEVLVYNADTGQMVANDANVAGTSFTPPASLSSGSYQVYVRGINASNVAGGWGTSNFSVTAPGAPTITGPVGTTNDSTPTITWNAAAGADHYEVLVYNTTRGAQHVNNNNVAGTSITVGTAMATDAYRVYVRAVNSSGDAGAWSSQAFSVNNASTPGTVNVTGPVGSTNDTTPTISWDAATNADHYEILVYSTTRGVLITNSNNVAGTSFTVGSPIAVDSYQVYVRAVAADSTTGGWTSHGFAVSSNIIPGNVGITGPSGSSNDATPTLTWNAATNADHYEFLVYSTTRGQLVANNANVNGTSFTIVSTLADDSYTVYVRAVSSDSTQGTWSSENFSISTSTAPGNVTVTGPNGSMTDSTPTVNWNAAANAVSYEIHVYSMTQGQLVESATNIGGTSFTLSTNLTADSYRIYVRAVCAANSTGNWTAHDFNVAAAAPLSATEFLDAYWELASSSANSETESALWPA